MFVIFLLQGLNFLLPVIDNIRYVQSLKENAIDIPSQSAITEGNKQWLIKVISNLSIQMSLPSKQ